MDFCLKWHWVVFWKKVDDFEDHDHDHGVLISWRWGLASHVENGSRHVDRETSCPCGATKKSGIWLEATAWWLRDSKTRKIPRFRIFIFCVKHSDSETYHIPKSDFRRWKGWLTHILTHDFLGSCRLWSLEIAYKNPQISEIIVSSQDLCVDLPSGDST